MENVGYVLAAFIVAWIAVFGYLWVLSSRQRRLGREIETLKEAFKGSGGKH